MPVLFLCALNHDIYQDYIIMTENIQWHVPKVGTRGVMASRPYHFNRG